MNTSTSLAFRVLATDNASATFRAVGDGAEKAHGRLEKLTSVGKKAGLAFATVGAAAVVLGVKTASGLEQARIGFTTMLGSATKADAFLKKLQTFAAATPFEFPELVSASQRLIAMGVNAKDVIPYLTGIGDAVAGLGGGAEMISQVTTAIGQMSAKGKIQSDELLQLTEAGIPALKILAAQYGVTTTQMQKMIESGTVMAKDALPKLIEGIEKGTTETAAFGGMMEKQSHTLAGLWSTVKDTVSMSLANMIAPALPKIEHDLALVGDALNNSGDIADKVGRGMARTFDVIEQAVRVVGPPVLDIAHSLGDILAPVIRNVSAVAVPLAAVVGGTLVVGLKGLAVALDAIADHADVFALVSVGALVFVGTMKAATAVADGAKAAYAGIISLYETMALKAMYAGDAVQMMTTKQLIAKGATLALGIATTVAAVALMVWAKKHADAQQAVAEHKARVDGLTGALEQNKGAIDANVKKLVVQQAEQRGMLKIAADVGISMETYTAALMGNTAAQDKVTAAAREAHAQKRITIEQAILLAGGAMSEAGALKEAQAAYGRQAAALGVSTEGTKGATAAAADHAKKLAEEKQKADDLYVSLMKLAGQNLDVIETQAQFADSIRELGHSLDGLNAAQKRKTRSLTVDTEEGSKARQQLVGNIRTIFAHADALRAQGKTTDQVRASTAHEVDILRQHYYQLGYNRQQVDAVVRSLGDLGRQKPRPKVTVDTSAAVRNVAALNTYLTNIDGRRVRTYVDNYTVSRTTTAGPSTAGHAAGGVAEGWSWVGERGAELAYFSQPAVIYTAEQSRKIGQLPGVGKGGGGVTIGQVTVVLQAATGREAALEFAAEMRKLNRQGYQVPTA